MLAADITVLLIVLAGRSNCRRGCIPKLLDTCNAITFQVPLLTLSYTLWYIQDLSIPKRPPSILVDELQAPESSTVHKTFPLQHALLFLWCLASPSAVYGA